MTDDTEARQRLLTAAQAASRALGELVEAWADAAHDDSELDVKLAVGYPFSANLEEVDVDMQEWVSQIKEILAPPVVKG